MRLFPRFRLALLVVFPLSCVSIFASADGKGAPTDPASEVRSYRLANGTKVVLSPSSRAKTFQIRVRVDAGDYNEPAGKAGVAHLLEHYLFTDAKLGPDKTYLETIKEMGGSANAATSRKATTYYATVPAKLTEWIVDTFGQMIFDKKFEEARVEHSKGPVFLEIGRPSFFDYLWDAVFRVTPDFVRAPDFWETEFRMREPHISVNAPRLDTQGLKAADLKDFYERYYHPDNMTVLLGGNFDPEALGPKIEEIFGSSKRRPGGGGWKEPKPQARISTYESTAATSETPFIQVGTKVTGLAHEDEIALSVYLEYLSHRLMKELRNKKGETYTVRPDLQLRQGSGKATIHLEAPAEKYAENLERVRGLIDAEARKGGLTREMFDEATALYRKRFELSDRDSGTMMWQAWRRDELERNYPGASSTKTDFEVFSALTYPELQRRLKAAFDPRLKFEELHRPPLFFRYDSLLTNLIAFALWMRLGRRLLARPFAHGRQRWTRKLTYPPAYLLQFMLVCAALTLTSSFVVVLRRAFMHYGINPFAYLVMDYLGFAMVLGLSILFCQLLFAQVARKLIIVDEALWIKSLGYWSRVIPLSEVENVELVRPLGLTPAHVFRIKHRFHYFDPCFWRRGLLIHLRSGRSYFLSVRDPARALNELKSLLPREQSSAARSPLAHRAA